MVVTMWRRFLKTWKFSTCIKLQSEVQSMPEKRIIKSGHSPWLSLVVLEGKKDRSLRFCDDYHNLNAVTQFASYPLPRIDKTLDHLSEAQWFTTLDLISGYWKIGLTPEAKRRAHFVHAAASTCGKSWRLACVTLKAMFKRLMERVLQGLQWHTCLVYIDNVVVFGQDSPAA